VDLRAASRRAVAVAAAVASIGLVAAAPAGARDAGTGATGSGSAKRELCYSGSRTDLGASYVYTVKARNLGCDRAIKLVKQYHQCRHDHGGWNGHCGGFKGFSCTQKKIDSSPSVLDAKGKCVKGDQKFVNEFQEDR
jgi:hypothetical protein